MKKTSVIVFLLIFTLFVSACSNQSQFGVSNSSLDADNTAEPVYAKDIDNGMYEITVDSDSSMFRVIKCELTVEDGEMYAVMTMSGQGYGMIYMGTGEEALKASEDKYIPFVLNENGEKTFTMPIEALNTEINCAAWSIKKEKWYDRTLVFEATTALTIADGTYSAEVTLTGGTGKTKIEDSTVVIENGIATATIVWSSPFYEYMLIGDTRYEPIQKSGNSAFEIPIVLDEEMNVSASTVAMSQPHLIEYALYFDSDSLIGE